MAKQPNDARPFAQRRQSWSARRASERRARERAAAWAAAMPPPDPAARVDPFNGQAADPQTPVAAPHPAGREHVAPQPAPIAPVARPRVGPSMPTRPDTSTDGTRPSAPTRRRLARRPGTVPTVDDAVLPSLSAMASQRNRPSLPARVTSPWPGRTGQAALYVGTPVSAAAVMVGVGVGLPVLGHGWDLPWLAAAVGVAAVAAGAASRGWAASSAKLRLLVPAAATLLAAAFCVGVASDPVVVDGKVYLATTKTAKSARLADEMRGDLFLLVSYDDLLAAGQADARANVNRYGPAQTELLGLSVKYERYASSPAALPDPSFLGPVRRIQTSAYWGAEAMEARAALIEQADAKTAADLDSFRATYAEEALAGGTELQAVTTSLGIPFTIRPEGPHE